MIGTARLRAHFRYRKKAKDDDARAKHGRLTRAHAREHIGERSAHARRQIEAARSVSIDAIATDGATPYQLPWLAETPKSWWRKQKISLQVRAYVYMGDCSYP